MARVAVVGGLGASASNYLKVLTGIEAKIVDALAQTLYPREGGIPLDSRQSRMLEYVDSWLAALPGRERFLVRLMFVMYEVAMPLLRPTRGLLFTRATAEERREYLREWQDSSLYLRRMAFMGLRSTLALAYMADPEVNRQMGVDDGVATLHRQRMEEQSAAADSDGAGSASPEPKRAAEATDPDETRESPAVHLKAGKG